MKNKISKWLLPCILLQAFVLTGFAQTKIDTVATNENKKTTATIKDVGDTSSGKVKIDTAKNPAPTKKDTAAKKENVIPSIDTTAFNAWKYAKAHPEILYTTPLRNAGTLDAAIRIVVIIFLLYFLYKAFYFFNNTALCRDESYFTDPADGQVKPRPEKMRPFSYSRVQLFYWTIIIATCYGLFFALYGQLLPFSPSCIILLGSGLAIQILGKTIDGTQRENDQNNAAVTGIPALHQDLSPTKGFLVDILSDDNGISMHRLQVVVFNVIYGIGFISFFVTALNNIPPQYPLIEFEDWQLALLGISSAGYLGLKTTENGTGTENARVKTALQLDANAKAIASVVANLQPPIVPQPAADAPTDQAEHTTVPRDPSNYE